MRCQHCNGILQVVEQDQERTDYECRYCHASYQWRELPAGQYETSPARAGAMFVIDDLWSQS
jgi:DNA-directed RNA polymerase subunit M/transcription elongation factor TFIIS